MSRLDRVAVLRRAVAEVIDEIDLCRHPLAERDRPARQALEHLGLGAAVTGRFCDLQGAKDLRGAVPLDRELVVRDHRAHLVDLGDQRLLVARADHVALLLGDEAPGRRDRVRDRKQEPRARRDLSRRLKPREVAVRRDRDLGMAQIVEMYAFERDVGAHPVAIRRIAAKHRLAGVLELRILGKQRLEPAHPLDARAGLAVGNARRLGSEHARDGLEYFGRVGERDAADKMDVISWHGGLRVARLDGVRMSTMPPACGSSVTQEKQDNEE
jgi:hypothetical protein